MEKQKTSYSKTVLLPKTDFPMRAGLSKKEPEIIKFWDEMDLYKKMLEMRKDKKPYILHDGPPYANGHLHMGHSLNKILKDIAVKSHSMAGYNTPYIPGWDCHGLPIEYALMKELKLDKKNITDVADFRKKARKFAAKFVKIQKEEFRRLGVTGDWDNHYETMSPEYEARVMEIFLEFFKKGYVYRGKKSVYWCVSCETALADAETEYENKTSPSVYVKLEIENPPSEIFGTVKPVSLIIWTTTPWTLPANRAAAVCKHEAYLLLKERNSGEYYVVAQKLAENFQKECNFECKKVSVIAGHKLVELKYHHPFEKKLCPVIYTDFVAMDTGTGIVHIAPGHGEEDFKAALDWNIEIFCPVDQQGRYTAKVPEFEGLKVQESNGKICEKLKSLNLLLAEKDIIHSYPNCWRCKNPVIFRSTEQWFLQIDKKDLRPKLLEEIKKVNWVPPSGRDRMYSMVQNRPDWCLSRQRFWGTPISVIYCKKCNKPQIDDKLFSAIVSRAYKEGSDFWFEKSVEEIVPKDYKCSCGEKEFVKENDILDVWLDSGVSWSAVLEMRKKTIPCDLYLEGSDQHRGWFQTSLIPAVALKNTAPYKTVFTHGFVLDGEGKAMHKSVGNVVSPLEIINKYGADILRLWVCMSDYFEDIRISEKLLSGPIDTYRKLRNTIRYILGNLWDYQPSKHKVPDEKLPEMDIYIKILLGELIEKTKSYYAKFQYRKAIKTISDFCILDLSSFYFDSLKDRLYTLGTSSPERRSAQTVIFETIKTLLKLLAPVLSFTAEEAWIQMQKIPVGKNLMESIFLEDFPESFSISDTKKIKEKWDKIRTIRETVLKALEEARQKNIIGSPLEAKIIFKTADKNMQNFLKDTLALWPCIAIISQAEIDYCAKETELEVKVSGADGTKCPRCWQWKTDIGKNPVYPDLCQRCSEVLKREDINA